uniref:Uncharacterized protein n=1 Tax=Arion vulgaris TaxID=1028688 RepID=A0A0B7ACR6_9EUPU
MVISEGTKNATFNFALANINCPRPSREGSFYQAQEGNFGFCTLPTILSLVIPGRQF